MVNTGSEGGALAPIAWISRNNSNLIAPNGHGPMDDVRGILQIEAFPAFVL
jgi:hypothetical protein